MRDIFDNTVLLLQMILINIVLSGDNAVIIAMACKCLPKEQRNKAIWWGTLGAVLARIILTISAIQIMGIPYLQLIGALLLIWIAIKLLTDQETDHQVQQATSLRNAIWVIVIADIVMSLDNVLAIAAKGQGNILLTIAGVALSIPMIIWGSQLIMTLIHRYPILIFVGAALLGYTAGELVVRDDTIHQLWIEPLPVLHWTIPIVTTLLVLASKPMLKMFKNT